MTFLFCNLVSLVDILAENIPSVEVLTLPAHSNPQCYPHLTHQSNIQSMKKLSNIEILYFFFLGPFFRTNESNIVTYINNNKTKQSGNFCVSAAIFKIIIVINIYFFIFIYDLRIMVHFDELFWRISVCLFSETTWQCKILLKRCFSSVIEGYNLHYLPLGLTNLLYEMHTTPLESEKL